MGIVNRISTLFKAKAERTVENMEKSDPIGIMKVALNEARENAVELEHAMRNATASKLAEDRKLESLKNSLDDWTDKFKLAKSGGDEDLARQVAEKVIEFQDKYDNKKVFVDKMRDTYDRNKALYDDKISEIKSYEDKVNNAEDSFEMSSAMNSMSTSVSSAGGKSSLDKIDAMMSTVERSADMATATADLSTTADDKLDDKLENLGRTSRIDEMMK